MMALFETRLALTLAMMIQGLGMGLAGPAFMAGASGFDDPNRALAGVAGSARSGSPSRPDRRRPVPVRPSGALPSCGYLRRAAPGCLAGWAHASCAAIDRWHLTDAREPPTPRPGSTQGARTSSSCASTALPAVGGIGQAPDGRTLFVPGTAGRSGAGAPERRAPHLRTGGADRRGGGRRRARRPALSRRRCVRRLSVAASRLPGPGSRQGAHRPGCP